MPSASLVIGFLVLIGLLGARLNEHGLHLAQDRVAQGLVGIVIGLAAALAILVPRMDVVPDAIEAPVVIVGAAAMAGTFALARAWWAR